ncbi:MAG: glutathione S-transferase [Gammaproteobacteria bacterium]|nr:glutathione S-transferase [Gammaproteobacteria bacterium]
MKLFWAPQTRSQRAIWMLEETAVDYEMQRIALSSPDRADSTEFLGASPMGKVPAIVDGEVAMSEKFNNVESNRFRSGWGDFDLMIETWDAALEGRDWIVTDQFTAADVMLGASAIFLRMFNMLPPTNNLDACADRCMARPA